MKKITKSILLVFVIFSLSTVVGFAETRSLSLEESINLSKDNSELIRGIENQFYDIDRTIKTNIQNANKLESAMEGYYDFVNIYEQAQNSQHPLHKYIGRSKKRLDVDLDVLDEQYEMLMAYGMTAQADQVLDVMSFINAYKLIGDNPELTKEAKYETFRKNENLLRNSVELIHTKYEEGLSAAKRGTEAGVIKLYVGLSDLGQGIELKKTLYAVYEEGLENMKQSYDQGMVAGVTYENQVRTVELMALEIENMTYQYDNLMYQLKLMCEIPMMDKVILSTSFNHEDSELSSPDTYFEQAYSTNMEYINLMAELEFNQKNFAVMNKYLDDIDDETDTPTPIYYQEKEDMKETLADLQGQLANKEQVINCNVLAAYNDLRVKKKLMDQNMTALNLAEEQLNATINSYKLGLRTKLELDQVKLNYENVKFTADTNVRAYNKGMEQFNLLINYGVAYEL